VESETSSGVLVDHAEVEVSTMGHVVVTARCEEHRADVGGLGKDAGLLSEREAAVDVVAAVDCVKAGDQVFSEHCGRVGL
jgi:hypothetical protein